MVFGIKKPFKIMDNKTYIPIFKSHYSIGRSILTCEEAEDDINESNPISIFTIAKKYNIDKIFLADSSFSGFIQAFQSAEKIKKQLIFGVTLVICENADKKDDESRFTESKVTVWMRNSDAYKSAIKIYSAAATKYFYYYPRLSWPLLQSMWDDNLLLTLPFYHSFLKNNILRYNYRAIPDFGKIKPVFEESNCELPFDNIIKDKLNNYIQNNQYEKIYTHPVYYFSKKCFEAYKVFRCISERTTYTRPNLDFFGSDSFDFETHLGK